MVGGYVYTEIALTHCNAWTVILITEDHMKITWFPLIYLMGTPTPVRQHVYTEISLKDWNGQWP